MIVNYLKKHVVLLSFIVFIVTMPLAWLLIQPVTHLLTDNWANTVRYTATAFLSIASMYFIWRRPIFSFRNSNFFKGLFTFGLLGLIGAVGAFFFSRDVIDLSPTFTIVLSCILLNLAIAVSEEFLFRGVILNAMIRVWGNSKSCVYRAVFVCSAIFGIRHLLNLFFTPDAVFLTCAQVVFTFMAGLYLSAVYLRTQNIWICITIHFLEDISVSIWEIFSTSAAASASADGTFGAALGMVAMQIPYVVFAILMLRDKTWRYTSSVI